MSSASSTQPSQAFLVRRLGAIAAAFESHLRKLSRYTLVGIAALTLDLAVFQTLTMNVQAPLAAALGYLSGMALHYTLSVRFVFTRVTQKSKRRTMFEFLVSGLIGLAITAAIVWGATTGLGLSPLLAKATAVIASFFAVFLLRSAIVFKPVAA